jgi:hypothetical protein
MLFACTALVFMCSWWSRQNPFLTGAALAVGFALLAGALWPLLATLWLTISSFLLGKIVLSALHIRTEQDNWLTNLLVGAGLYGTAVGLFAYFPVHYPGVYGIALALPIIFYRRTVINQFNRACTWVALKNQDEFRFDWLGVAIVVVALVYFVVALMPEVGFDSLAMHLFVPGHLALRHQWAFDARTYVWAVMPMLGDWIFSIGYVLAGETAARLINVGFIFIICCLVRNIVLWAGGSAIGGRLAVLLFLSTPLTFTEGSTLFIESVWTSFVVAGALAILSSCSSSGKPRFELPVAGLLLGYALAAKAVTFTILPVLLLVLIWRYKSWFKTADLPLLVLGLSLFLAFGSIPYMIAWYLTDNPVFPFFNHIFKSDYYHTSVFTTVFGKGLTWDFLYKVTFDSEKYLEATVGASGFQWLLLFLPASFAIFTDRQRRGIALLFVGVMSIALAFHSTSYLRYVFPAWAILAAFIGVTLDLVFSKHTTLKNLGYMVTTATLGLNLLFLSSGSFYRDFTLKSIADTSSRELYLAERLPIRRAVDLINQLNIGRTPVAVFGNPLTAGLSGDALYPNWYNFAFQREIDSIHTELDIAAILLKHGVDFIILDANWNGAGGLSGPKARNLIEKATEKLAAYGSINIRRVKTDYRFKTEMLNNPDFTEINGWGLAPETKYDPETGVILASVNSTAFQGIAVSSGGRYLNTVVARCAKELTLGRIQINWLDSNGEFIRADITTFECSPAWAEHSMEVTAPSNSINAVVYVAGQSTTPLEFTINSLKQ